MASKRHDHSGEMPDAERTRIARLQDLAGTTYASGQATESIVAQGSVPPAHVVFNTTELLELILLEVPMKDLLLAQRTCRKWKDVIETSSPIQVKLFLKPAPRQLWIFDSKDRSLSKASRDRIQLLKAHEEAVVLAILNSFICQQDIDKYQQCPIERAEHPCWEFGVRLDRRFRGFHVHKLFTRGSWQGMLISQPPPTAVSTVWRLTSVTGDFPLVSLVSNAHGVTLGDLMKHAEHEQANHENNGPPNFVWSSLGLKASDDFKLILADEYEMSWPVMSHPGVPANRKAAKGTTGGDTCKALGTCPCATYGAQKVQQP